MDREWSIYLFPWWKIILQQGQFHYSKNGFGDSASALPKSHGAIEQSKGCEK